MSNLKLAFVIEAIDRAGYTPGEQIAIGLDCAASEFHKDGLYHLAGENLQLTSPQLVDYLANLADSFPIVSIEDGMAEGDWDGWKILTERLGQKVQLVGDDLFVTNTERLAKGIQLGAGNAILIKLNQIGSLTETIDAVDMAHRAGYKTMMSHRSGETEDATIADLAVATKAGGGHVGVLIGIVFVISTAFLIAKALS